MYTGTQQSYKTLGDPTEVCQYCGAIMWREECNNKSANQKGSTFSLCCAVGEIKLPDIKQPPKFLADIYLDQKKRRHYNANIRAYNSMFAFSSIGGKVDGSINSGNAPYSFRLNGQNHHRIGSLLPEQGANPRFCQLYIYDTDNEVNNRIKAVCKNKENKSIDPEIVEGLMKMLDDHNILVKAFRMARDRFKEGEQVEVNLILKSSRSASGRPNLISPSDEVAALMVGDMNETNGQRDIVVETNSGHLKRISDCHPLYMQLQYPLLFPYGEDGFHPEIPYVVRERRKKKKRKYVTMREYYAFVIQVRLNQGNLFNIYQISYDCIL